jgi:hypothetical protein
LLQVQQREITDAIRGCGSSHWDAVSVKAKGDVRRHDGDGDTPLGVAHISPI